jgi:hypothetical protein
MLEGQSERFFLNSWPILIEASFGQIERPSVGPDVHEYFIGSFLVRRTPVLRWVCGPHHLLHDGCWNLQGFQLFPSE